MKCHTCGNKLGFTEAFLLMFHFHLVINRFQKHLEFDFPLCTKCFREFGVKRHAR